MCVITIFNLMIVTKRRSVDVVRGLIKGDIRTRGGGQGGGGVGGAL